jgi:hypothetical protein
MIALVPTPTDHEWCGGALITYSEQAFECDQEEDGAQRRIRTTDTRIFSPLLYQLSYLGLFRQTKLRAPDFIKAPWGAP